MSCGIEGLVLAMKLQTEILADMVPTGWATDAPITIDGYYLRREKLYDLKAITRMCENPIRWKVPPTKIPLATTRGCYTYDDYGIIMCDTDRMTDK